MNIYERKQYWKIFLFIGSLLIFAWTWKYTSDLVQKLENEEKSRAKLWAKAISEKARLVRKMNRLFQSVVNDEKQKAELLGQAFVQIAYDPEISMKSIKFYSDLIINNKSIPIIMTDENGKIESSKNLPESIQNNPIKLKKELKRMKKLYPPIKLVITPTLVKYLYYSDSYIFLQLKKVFDASLNQFVSEVISSANIPVICTDHSQLKIIAHNLNSFDFLKGAAPDSVLKSLKSNGKFIKVSIAKHQNQYVYYQESSILTQLRYFPYLQYLVLAVFLAIGYAMFNTSRRAEQNRVWVGMSKETAHQLGTPISSLMAWTELLDLKYPNDELIDEVKHDVHRLEVIANRFEKIGSEPQLEPLYVNKVVQDSIKYLQKRVPNKVSFGFTPLIEEEHIAVNMPLFSWVLENITKNAVDAMEGQGSIHFTITSSPKHIFIDIKDSGKGISRSKFSTVFKPGFSTKKRGWGLGLALVKRIVQEYHNGKVFVKESEVGIGTTFRIVLNKK